VFLVEWRVLKNAIDRHRTSRRGAHVNAWLFHLFPVATGRSRTLGDR
jgi:hypothetical protein